MGFLVNGSESNSLNISHLLCKDDTLIFCGTNYNTRMHFRYVLTRFEAISSLKVNLGKLEMVSVGIVQNMEEMIHIMDAKFQGG